MAFFGFRHYLECQIREQEGIAANSSYDCGYLLIYLATGQGFQGSLGVQAVVSHCAHVLRCGSSILGGLIGLSQEAQF